jgi:uncharacterized protein YraI
MPKRIFIPALVVFALIAVVLPLAPVFAQIQFGTNWTATYYNCYNLDCSAVTSQTGINGINAVYSGSPASGVNPDNFSIRFESVQQFVAGTYEFIVTFDDGARVYIDNALVLDRFAPGGLRTERFQQTLTEGPHSLRVEYADLEASGQIQFQYLSVTGGGAFPTATSAVPLGPTAIPTRLPPTPLPAIPAGALTATVIDAAVLNVRAAPFLGAGRVGRILRGQTYAIVGRDENAEWFLLQLSGQQAWAWGFYLFVNGNSFTAPVVSSFSTQGQPAASSSVTVQTEAGMRLRAAPTQAAVQTGRIPWGEIMPVIGRTAGGDWYQVIFRGTVGWVASGFVRVLEGDINSLPVTG